jgi:hypothetical protein
MELMIPEGLDRTLIYPTVKPEVGSTYLTREGNIVVIVGWDSEVESFVGRLSLESHDGDPEYCEWESDGYWSPDKDLIYGEDLVQKLK